MRRGRAQGSRLSPELEPLARGDTDKLRRPRGRPRLRDPRPVALVPGVANREARAVHDARLARLQQAVADAEASEDTAALARQLAEVVRLGLWRGRSLTGFDVFAEQMAGLEPARARELARQGADAMGIPCERASDEAVAAWMRAEAALHEAGIDGRVVPAGADAHERLQLDVPAAHAPEAFDAVARRMKPLLDDRKK